MKLKFKYIAAAVVIALMTSCEEDHIYYNTAAKASITAESEYEVGVPITFTDSSVPTQGTTITDYFWEFGDAENSTSTERNPTFTYKKDGTYTVTLTITDSNALRSRSQQKIVVTNPTKADFYLEKSEYYMGDVVRFIDASTAKAPTTIVSYKWEFADEDMTVSTEQNPSFVYHKEGSYPVKLTVTDSYGLTKSVTKSVSIQDPSKIIATMWTAELGGAVKGGSSPALSPDGSLVYMIRSLDGANEAKLCAYNAADGVMAWSLNLSEAMQLKSPTAQAKDVFSSPSVAADGTVMMVVRDLQSTTAERSVMVLAVNQNGSVKWVHKGGVSGTNLFAITPAIDAAGNIFVATRGSEVWKLTPEGSATVWSTEGLGATAGLTISRKGNLYGAANGANGFFCMDTNSGAFSWKYNTDFGSAPDAFTGALRSAQASIDTDGTVYFVTDCAAGGMVIAFNPDGTTKWIHSTAGAIPDGGVAISKDGTLYVNGGTAAAEGLIALDRNGNRLWAFSTKSAVQTTPVIDDRGYIHIVDAQANYYVVKEDGTLYTETQIGQSCTSAPVMDASGRLFTTVLKEGVPTVVCVTSKASSYDKDAVWAMRGQNPQRTGLQK